MGSMNEFGPIGDRFRLVTAGATLSALVLSGCAVSASRPENGSAQTTSTRSEVPPSESAGTGSPPSKPNIEPTSCPEVSIPVFPSSRFNKENEGSIQKQLDALRVAKTPGAEVGASTIVNANAIVANALIDNVYSKAFSGLTGSDANALPSAQDILSQTFNVGAGDCLTGQQLREVNLLFQTLVGGLAPQVGRQLGAGATVLHDSFSEQYQEFKKRYQSELAQ